MRCSDLILNTSGLHPKSSEIGHWFVFSLNLSYCMPELNIWNISLCITMVVDEHTVCTLCSKIDITPKCWIWIITYKPLFRNSHFKTQFAGFLISWHVISSVYRQKVFVTSSVWCDDHTCISNNGQHALVSAKCTDIHNMDKVLTGLPARYLFYLLSFLINDFTVSGRELHKTEISV